MTTNVDINDNGNEEVIEDLTPPDISSEGILENTDSGDGNVEVADTTIVDTSSTTTPSDILTEAPPEPPPTVTEPPIDQRSLEELHQLRAANAEKAWREQLGRQARAYEEELNNRGYLPEQARDQAKRYIQAQQQTRQQRQEAAEMVGFLEGRQNAAIHFMKENGLASQQMLDDLASLQRANTPDEMKREASRMKRERALIAENARLKQGVVQPQSFDNSQGAAEAQPNDARLLDAYINGDRSEAAIRAVERSMNGG